MNSEMPQNPNSSNNSLDFTLQCDNRLKKQYEKIEITITKSLVLRTYSIYQTFLWHDDVFIYQD